MFEKSSLASSTRLLASSELFFRLDYCFFLRARAAWSPLLHELELLATWFWHKSFSSIRVLLCFVLILDELSPDPMLLTYCARIFSESFL